MSSESIPARPLEGGVVIVTGASRGIGKSIASRLLADGARVIGTATRQIGAAESMSGVEYVSVDFSDQSQLELFAQRVAEMPRIDAFINNAGINRIKPFGETTDRDFEILMRVDLEAPFILCRAAAGVMKRQGGGRIVNVASIWSVVTKPQRSLYSTAKTGLVGMTRALAAELGVSGILVNSVSPGFVLTDLTRQSLSSEEIAQLSAQIPCRRLADPSEVAELVSFLAGPRNTYITGQNLVIDGGFTIV